MATKVKICCMGSLAEAHVALTLGADALGFVSDMPSGPGIMGDDKIAETIRDLPGDTNTFLLTSRTAPDEVAAHIHQCNPSTVQLVDAVPEETYATLRKQASHVCIVQVIHVQDGNAVDQAQTAEEHVDAILLDSGRTENGVRRLGGTGDTHDWSVSRAVVDAVDKPVCLAGGLNADNVCEAIETVRPYGVDLCTGVRTDKKLDESKSSAFMEAVSSVDGEMR